MKSIPKVQWILSILIAGFYISFLWFDISHIATEALLLSIILKYLSVIGCFLIALLRSFTAQNRRDASCLVLALFFTLIADTILLFWQANLFGTAVFCFVHLFYIRRHKPGRFRPSLVAVITVIACCVTLNLLFANFPIEYAFSGLYAILFIVDIVSCIMAPCAPEMRHKRALGGLFLFLLCDIHVAIFNLFPSTSFYGKIAAVAMWLFYVPAQFLLATSSTSTWENASS